MCDASFSSNHSLDLSKYLGPGTVSIKMKSFLSGKPLKYLIQAGFLRQNKNINPTIYGIVIESWFWIFKFYYLFWFLVLAVLSLYYGVLGITKNETNHFFLIRKIIMGQKQKIRNLFSY